MSLSEPEKNKYLTIVYESSKKLSGLVEQLFQYAKLEANLVTRRKNSFLMNELASDILMAYHLKARKRNIHISLDTSQVACHRSLPTLRLQKEYFKTCWIMRLSYTPDGGSITIHLIGNQCRRTGKGC